MIDLRDFLNIVVLVLSGFTTTASIYLLIKAHIYSKLQRQKLMKEKKILGSLFATEIIIHGFKANISTVSLLVDPGEDEETAAFETKITCDLLKELDQTTFARQSCLKGAVENHNAGISYATGWLMGHYQKTNQAKEKNE